MKGIRTPLILMAAMLLTAFAANDIRHDMVKFDRIYIAALALTLAMKYHDINTVKDGTLYVQASAGVVADSVPELEWKETEHKARALLRASELVEEGLE